MSLENPTATEGAVLIWREQVLPGSETFIRNHVRGLRRFQGLLAGTMRVRSPLSAPDDVVCYGDSFFDRLSRLLAARTGIAPRLIRQLWLAKNGHGPLSPEGTPVRLVHAHFVNDAWFIALAAKVAGLPLIVTCHGYDVTEKPNQPGISGALYRLRAKIVFALADEVIAVSDFIADRVRELGCASPIVRYNGIDVSRENELPSGVDGAESVSVTDIVFVGRLVGKKGVADLLTAAHDVALTRGDVSVRVVGDGPLRGELERRARELTESAALAGARLTVLFEGSREPEIVAEMLRSAKVFVGPSTTADNGDCEGLGQVFLEAALAGLPCVSRIHGGIPEAIEHGVTGLLSDESDNRALSAHISTLLADDDLRRHMGRAGRRRVQEHFNLAECLAKIEQDYLDVIERG